MKLNVGDSFIYLRCGVPTKRHVGILPSRHYVVMDEKYRIINVYSSIEAIQQHYKIVEVIKGR